MPLFEYECRSCEARFEHLTSRASADDATCPRCGASEPRRLLSVIAGMATAAPERSAPPAGCGAGACGACS